MVTIPAAAGDLFNTCALLKRQHDFLQTNLSNMEKWCKDNFSESDYNATYGSKDKKKKMPPIELVLKTFKKPLIKVKIKFSGFKEPKLSGPLFALLPTSVVPPPPIETTSNNKEKKVKKRKSEFRSAPRRSKIVRSATSRRKNTPTL